MNIEAAVNRIIEARAERHWSMGRLAARSGLSLHGIWKIEHRKVVPRIETIERLCHALEIPVEPLTEATDG